MRPERQSVASSASLRALAAKRLGHCGGQHLSTWNVNKWPVFEGGGSGGRAWPQAPVGTLELGQRGSQTWIYPWSLPLLTLKCGWGASVRILRHCPSTCLPPRTVASRVRGQLGPPPWGAGGPGVLSPPALSGSTPGGGDWAQVSSCCSRVPGASLPCCADCFLMGCLSGEGEGTGRPSGSAHLSCQHCGGPRQSQLEGSSIRIS